jgi:hypothetical protein
MASSLENEITHTGKALDMGGLETGDTSEPGCGLRTCFGRDLFDRTMALERAASRFD